MVFVCSEPVMVLGMIVICVRVDVQRRDLAGNRGQDQSEQDRYQATHSASVCNPVDEVKPVEDGASRTSSSDPFSMSARATGRKRFWDSIFDWQDRPQIGVDRLEVVLTMCVAPPYTNGEPAARPRDAAQTPLPACYRESMSQPSACTSPMRSLPSTRTTLSGDVLRAVDRRTAIWIGRSPRCSRPSLARRPSRRHFVTAPAHGR